MIRFVATTLVSVLAALPLTSVALEGQERDIREANLPAEFETTLLRLYGQADAARYTGQARVPPGDEVRSDLAATGGPLRVEGRVTGSVAMLGGDVAIGPDGSVAGDVVVVGGAVRLEDGARVGGQIVEFTAPALRSRYAGRSYDGGRAAEGNEPDIRDDRDPWRSSPRWAYHGAHPHGFSVFTVRAGPTYNRVEGLPILVGPSIRTRGAHALRLEALGVWRTASAPTLGAGRWGYRARVVQHLGSEEGLRVGGSAFSIVENLDRWKMSDEEASLATAVLRTDFRDHFGRDGWSVFLGIRPSPSLDLRLEYRDAEHRSLAVANPWSLFGGSDPWRLQPLVGEGRLQSAVGTVELDLRDHEGPPVTGWYGRLRVERGLGGELTRPALGTSVSEDGPSLRQDPLPGTLAPEKLATDFTSLVADLRHYAPVGRSSRLSFRAVGGGNVNRAPLPPQFQHALGGPGSLPGYSTLRADCGARAGAGTRNGGAFYPAYGCDRFFLGQVEYRGRLSLDLGFGDADRDEHEKHWHDVDVDVDLDPRWVVFFDAGRGWGYDDSLPGGRRTTGTLYDAGAGLLLDDDAGLYLAMPLNEGVERDVRFFIRLQRRF